MWHSQRFSAVVVLICSLHITSVQGQEFSREVIKRAQRATAGVEFGKGIIGGSAVCIDPAGYFVTNAHVVQMAQQEPIKLVLEDLNPPSLDFVPEDQIKDAVEFQTRVLRIDESSNLALLKIEPSFVLEFLELGHTSHLFETVALARFGFSPGRHRAGFPNVSVLVDEISAMISQSGRVSSIQIDGATGLGTIGTGGAVIDSLGKLVGVLDDRLQKQKNRSQPLVVIPVEDVVEFLSKPVIEIVPLSVNTSENAKSYGFDVAIRSLTQLAQQPSYGVELLANSSRLQNKRISATQIEGHFRFEDPIFEEITKGELTVDIKLGDEAVHAQVEDLQVLPSLKLSDIASMERSNQWRITPINGNPVDAERILPQSITVTVAGMSIPIKLAQATVVDVRRTYQARSDIKLQVRVIERQMAVTSQDIQWTATGPVVSSVSEGVAANSSLLPIVERHPRLRSVFTGGPLKPQLAFRLKSTLADLIVDRRNGWLYILDSNSLVVRRLHLATLRMDSKTVPAVDGAELMRIDPQGKRLYVAGSPIGHLPTSLDPKHQASVTPSGVLGVIPLDDWGQSSTQHLEFDPWDLAVRSDGTLFMTGGANSSIHVLNAEGREIANWPDASSAIRGPCRLLLSPSEELLFLAESKSTPPMLHVLPLPTNIVPERPQVAGSTQYDGDQLWLTSDGQYLMTQAGRVFSVPSTTADQLLSCGKLTTHRTAASSRGGQIFVVDSHSKLHVYSSTLQLVTSQILSQNVYRMAYDDDSKLLFCATTSQPPQGDLDLATGDLQVFNMQEFLQPK